MHYRGRAVFFDYLSLIRKTTASTTHVSGVTNRIYDTHEKLYNLYRFSIYNVYIYMYILTLITNDCLI